MAKTPESLRIVDKPHCLVEWSPGDLATKIRLCQTGNLPRPRALPPEVIEKAWQAELLNSEAEPGSITYDHAQEIRVSVCVAHFNKARDLREALDSLKAQTHKNLEVIVIDDASTNADARQAFATAAVDFASPNWIFIEEKQNRGPGHVRNLAARAATGSHLVFFDADDVAFPDMVERLLRGLAPVERGLRSGFVAPPA